MKRTVRGDTNLGGDISNYVYVRYLFSVILESSNSLFITHKSKIMFSIKIFFVMSLLCLSCKNSLDGKAGHWTDKQKKVFLETNQAGMRNSDTPGMSEEYIISMSECGLERISSQYDNDFLDKLSPNEAMKILKPLNDKCFEEYELTHPKEVPEFIKKAGRESWKKLTSPKGLL